MKKIKKIKLKLEVELVLAQFWGQSLYRLMRKSAWNKIRHKIYAQYNRKCGICEAVCEAKSSLVCHEIWTYDDIKHIQRLKDFIALCVDCHSVKHLGRTENISTPNKDFYEIAVEHFMKVNRCSREVFEEHKEQAYVKWEERGQHKWKIDFGKYKNLLK